MISFGNRKEVLILLAGDVAFFYLSLWVALSMRHFELAVRNDILLHFTPFSFLIAAWVLSFFIAGLYNKPTLIFRRKLPFILLHTQIINSVLAVFFFYFIPFFGVTPKTVLFIYLFVSFVFILAWRLFWLNWKGVGKKNRAILIGTGREVEMLRNEINNNSRHALVFVSSIDPRKRKKIDIAKELEKKVSYNIATVVVVDLQNEEIAQALPSFYNLLFSKVQVMDFHKVYEHVFDRIPISVIGYKWFLENIRTSSCVTYDVAKRIMDITISFALGLISLVIYPFVVFAIKLDDGKPVFINQERVGKNNEIIHIIKFRTMKINDGGKWVVKNDPRITRVGKFLRASRIDELPQLWNILVGDLSLVGPRPELPSLVRLYEREVPYYKVRHLIKPGLSGWGQIHHDKPPHSIEETKEKLSYDLYYIKHRSFLLDLEIALKTLKTLLSRSGV